MAFDFPSAPVPGQIYTLGTATYEWNGYAWMASAGGSTPLPGGTYVLRAGDTMTGFLTLSGQPTAPLHAATKAYVDVKVPPVGNDGEALVARTGLAVWGAPIDSGNYT